MSPKTETLVANFVKELLATVCLIDVEFKG